MSSYDRTGRDRARFDWQRTERDRGRDGQQLRMSDAEREQAAADLAEHYAQGRLTTEEHSERLDRIWAAKTRGELGPIFQDLPSGTSARASTGPASPRSRPARRFRGIPLPMLVLLAVLVAVAIVTHLPWILIGLGIWFVFARGACGARAHQRWR